MTCALVTVPPEQLAAVWPRLRDSIISIEQPDGWLPEDVYCAVKMGGASLYLVMVNDIEVGFLVLRALQDFDGPRLHIWILHAYSDADVMAEFSDKLDDLARQIKATRITFGTTRRGWEKVAPRYHFSVRETIWKREIAS